MRAFRFAEYTFFMPAVLLVAAIAVFFIAPNAARAEGLTVTGARLGLLQGSPEDMIRYSEGRPFVSFDAPTYPTPKPGDLVAVADEGLLVDIPLQWPHVVLIWEDCGAKAEFDYRDHKGYLNGNVFALLLNTPSAWGWLRNATSEDLTGVRYIEVQGAPPTDFAALLAKLPKKRIVVRCGAESRPLWPDALAPLDPVGLFLDDCDSGDVLDLRMFTACRVLSVNRDLRSVYGGYAKELRLPPALKNLLLGGAHRELTKISGAESALETILLPYETSSAEWLPKYRALTAVAVTGWRGKGEKADAFFSALASLPSLVLLRYDFDSSNMPLLSSLKQLKYLWLSSSAADLSPFSELKKLECLRLTQKGNCDYTPLATLTGLRHFSLEADCMEPVEENGEEEIEVGGAYDLATLSPVAARITRLSVSSDFDGILHLDQFSSFSSLEALELDCTSPVAVPIASLSSLRSLKSISGVFISGKDVPRLAKLPLLEKLSFTTSDGADFSSLEGCGKLWKMAIDTRAELNVGSLAAVTSLTHLSLSSQSSGLAGKREEVLKYKGLSKLKGLKCLYLAIKGLSAVDLQGLRESLVALQIEWSDVDDLTALGEMKSLRYLLINGCPHLDAPGIKLPPCLRSLYFVSLKMLENLSFLNGAESLVSCDLSNCPKLSALPKLTIPLVNLKSLDTRSCGPLSDTSGLASMPALESLMFGFQGKEITGFDSLKSLMRVTVDSSTLERIPVASPDAPIVEADLRCGESLTSIAGISKWQSLHSLEIDLGEKVLDISPLASLTLLRGLRLFGGKEVKDISPLTKMTWLKTLDLKQSAVGSPANTDLLKKALPGCQIFGKVEHEDEDEEVPAEEKLE